jgi:hypothetical protein
VIQQRGVTNGHGLKFLSRAWSMTVARCLEWTAGALRRDAVTVGGRASRKVFDLRILRHQVRPMYQIECSETLPSDA